MAVLLITTGELSGTARQATKRFRIFAINGRRSVKHKLVTPKTKKTKNPFGLRTPEHRQWLVEHGYCTNCKERVDRAGCLCKKCNDNSNKKHEKRRAKKKVEVIENGEEAVIHFCPWENKLIWGDEKLGEHVFGTRVDDPHRLLFKAILVEAMHRVEELLTFGRDWEKIKARDPVRHEMNRSRCRVHYEWIMDDNTYPLSFTFKELVELRESFNNIDQARDNVFERMPDASMKELLRPIASGEMRLARMNYVANKSRPVPIPRGLSKIAPSVGLAS